VVVAVHGFKGFRHWGFWPILADAFTAAGLAFVRYDASHNGVGPGGLEFDEEQLFERNTFGRELDDLRAVLHALGRRELPGGEAVDPARLALLGHSRGGGLVIVHAADDSRVRAVVALAPTASIRRFRDEDVEQGLERGFLPVVNTRTGQVLRVGRAALREIRERDDLADFTTHAGRLTAPLLVAHGTADPAVAWDDGRRLAAAAPHGRFEPFEGADHVLGCRHPWAGSNEHFDRFVGAAVDFVRGVV
jgi:alpha-beta hydrolase superfamily lysophospholipase